MSFYTQPIVNGCYLDPNSNMFKVRMLSYCGKEVRNVVIEDTKGKIRSINIDKWQNLRLIPCCYSSNEIHPTSPVTA